MALQIHLKLQLSYFKEVAKRLRQQLGDEDGQKLRSNAVYLFSMGGNDYMVLKTDPKLSVLTAAYKMTFMTMVVGNFTTVIKEVYSLGREEVCFPERRADRVHVCHPSILGDRRLPSRPVRASKDAQHRSVKAAEEAGLSARRILAHALRPLHLRHSANSVQLEIRIQVMEKRVLRERAVQRELHLWMRQERDGEVQSVRPPERLRVVRSWSSDRER